MFLILPGNDTLVFLFFFIFSYVCTSHVRSLTSNCGQNVISLPREACPAASGRICSRTDATDASNTKMAAPEQMASRAGRAPGRRGVKGCPLAPLVSTKLQLRRAAGRQHQGTRCDAATRSGDHTGPGGALQRAWGRSAAAGVAWPRQPRQRGGIVYTYVSRWAAGGPAGLLAWAGLGLAGPAGGCPAQR